MLLVRIEDGADRERMVMAANLSKRIEWTRFTYTSRTIGKSENQGKCRRYIYLITDPKRADKWNFRVFIVHMEGMREQLRGRDFKQHKEWVFNTHPDKVPSFKELMRAALIVLVRCCTKILL